jgi:YD repeat-containing protein
MTMRADEVHPGDAIDYYGELHRITRVEHRDGWAWPIACDDAGWAIALGLNLVVPHGNTGPPDESY